MSAAVAPKASFGCLGSTIRLVNGSYFDVANPDPDLITWDVIATGLSNVCRYGGQLETFYSVAEHCVLMLEGYWAEGGRDMGVQIAILLHDGSEAFLGDMPKPIKNLLPDYSRLEAIVQDAVESRFGVNPECWEYVKELDRRMLVTEKRALFGASEPMWTGEEGIDPLSVRPLCWPSRMARVMFLHAAAFIGVIPSSEGTK